MTKKKSVPKPRSKPRRSRAKKLKALAALQPTNEASVACACEDCASGNHDDNEASEDIAKIRNFVEKFLDSPAIGRDQVRASNPDAESDWADFRQQVAACIKGDVRISVSHEVLDPRVSLITFTISWTERDHSHDEHDTAPPGSVDICQLQSVFDKPPDVAAQVLDNLVHAGTVEVMGVFRGMGVSLDIVAGDNTAAA